MRDEAHLGTLSQNISFDSAAEFTIACSREMDEAVGMFVYYITDVELEVEQ